MKLTIDKAEFAATAALVARTLPARPTVPVLAGVKLTAVDGRLTATAFDWEWSVVHRLDARVTEPGEVIVSGRLLADIAKALPHEPVDLTSDGVRAVIACGTSRYTLHTLPREEYPALPATPPQSGTITGADFAAAVAQVAPASSRDQTLPVLTGVQLEADATHLTLVATDRYRFAVRRLPWTCPALPETTTALIPATTLADIAKTSTGTDSVGLHLPATDDLVGITAGPTAYTTRLLDGALPKWQNLLPTDDAITAAIRVERAALTDAIKRVALVLNRNQPILLNCAPGHITVSGGSSDDAQGHDRTDAVLDGNPIKVAFNPDFLLAALAAADTPELQLSLTTSTKPALITPATGQPTHDADLRYLVMPIRTTN